MSSSINHLSISRIGIFLENSLFLIHKSSLIQLIHHSRFIWKSVNEKKTETMIHKIYVFKFQRRGTLFACRVNHIMARISRDRLQNYLKLVRMARRSNTPVPSIVNLHCLPKTHVEEEISLFESAESILFSPLDIHPLIHFMLDQSYNAVLKGYIFIFQILSSSMEKIF